MISGVLFARLHTIATGFVTQDKSTPLPVSAGVWSFVLTGLVGLAVVVLCVLMARTVRRINYRAQVQEELQLELAQMQEQTQTGKNTAGDAKAAGEAA